MENNQRQNHMRSTKALRKTTSTKFYTILVLLLIELIHHTASATADFSSFSNPSDKINSGE